MTTNRFFLLLCFVLALMPFALAQEASVRCALLNDKSEVIEYREFKDYPAVGADGCPEDLPQQGLEWRPAPLAEKPAFDPATQVLEGPTVTVGASEVTTSYTVRSKTTQELAADLEASKEGKLGSVELFVLQTLCDHESRIRVLEGKSAITFNQCRQAIKDRLQ